jgi:uncharacterized membrane-anchored protein
MDQLNEINTNLDSVLALANFNEGFRYQDFDPQLDKVAAYGIGALIAGKVLSKAGLFAIALVFLKKFWIFLAIAIGAAVKILFKGKKTQKNASV